MAVIQRPHQIVNLLHMNQLQKAYDLWQRNDRRGVRGEIIARRAKVLFWRLHFKTKTLPEPPKPDKDMWNKIEAQGQKAAFFF
jgi:hypothetical protein